MRIKIWTAVVFTAACFQICMAQNQHKIDSLLNVLKRAKEDTTKVNTLNALGMALINNNPDTSIILANQALSLSEKAISKKHIADSYHLIGLADRLKGNYPSALDNNLKALSLREELADKLGIAKSLTNTGTVYKDQGDYPKGLNYYFKALKIFEELGHKQGIAGANGNIGIIYMYQGNYPEALKYNFASLKMDEELGNKIGISSSYNNLGLIYRYQGNDAEALKNILAALKIKEEIGDKNGASNCYMNIGDIYGTLGNYPEALKNSFTALKIKEEIGDKAGIALCHEGLGSTYRKQGDFTNALKNYFAALKMHEEIGDKRSIAFCINNIGNVYSEKGQYPEAIDNLNRSLQLATELGFKEIARSNYSMFSDVYEKMNDWKNAFKFQKLYFEMSDSLFNEAKSEQLTEMQAKYESEKKEKEIALLTKDKEIQNIAIKKQTLLKNSFIGVLALMLILSFFVYNNFRTANKLKLQNIRNKIASDLHDDVGSTLNSISVYSEVAKQKFPAVMDELEQIGDASRKIIEVMSDIVWTINPKNDTFENIILRMSTLTYNLLKAKNIEHTFQADEILNETKLSLESRRNFYLIFKEALNNLVKYSNATRASISLASENGLIKLSVRDNGVGFDVAQTSKGNGLLNMKDRAEEMNAQLKIESEKGSGTNVELILKA